jgi:predicted CXXCH cytochrome family protein
VDEPAPVPPPGARAAAQRRWAQVVIGVAIAGLIGLGVSRPWRDDPAPGPVGPPPAAPPRASNEDPRLTYPTPYRNVRPEVKFVGDAACAGCHVKHAESYRLHPMGRSLASLSTAAPLERYDAAAHNPFTAGSLTYRIDQRAGGTRHVETAIDRAGRPVAETAADVSYVVGSGRNGRAYLVDRDGFLFASPITWYPSKGVWDLSPGYEKVNPHFGRAITPDCLFCHANNADHVRDTLNRYRPPIFRGESIGCERCHGPGELHVQRRERPEPVDGPDDTIVNPGKLEHSLREAVCQQCHLQGHQRVWRNGADTFDFRPGLPAHLFMSEFVEPPGETGLKFVGAVEQMYASRCFQKGTGANKMGCISCHDPHSTPPPEQKVAFYRDRCMNCHKDRGCSLPPTARPGNDCAACHMPPTGSDLKHTTVSDHRILRRAEPAGKGDHPRPPQAALVNFHAHLLPADSPEAERALGIALVREADRRKPTGAGRGLVGQAYPLLQLAVVRDETDLAAREARGNALWDLGRPEDAMADYDLILTRAPDRESTLFVAATLATRLGRMDSARTYAERAVRVNPWRWEYRLALAQVFAQKKDWASVVRECREVLKLNATEIGARRLLVLGYARLKKPTDAQREFDTLMNLNPPQPEELRRWFGELMR